MAFQRHEFDEITRAEAEAIGVPGQRRFRMILGTQLDAAVLWLEKQQLQALGMAFEQMIAQLAAAGVDEAKVADIEPGPVGPAPVNAAELQVGRLAVGYDEQRSVVTLFIHDAEAGEDDAPNFVGRLSLQLASIMARQIEQVVSAGRPTCPRCRAPIDADGHVCPHDNGHFPHLVRDS
ncbi:MAG TPA: DUF3090 family protein [Thermomicrobiales bacterium]|nr:DUF3090 family protein [Thermomicrobiales bacterium]